MVVTNENQVPSRVDLSASGRNRVFDRLILAVVFVGGMSSIAVEIAAARLLGPYFGTSDFIWANLIGLTLLYLSIGYYVGGRIADRWPDPRLLLVLTAVAGAGTAAIPPLSRPILQQSLSAFANLSVGAFYGSLVGVILLFSVPVTLLGFVSPFAIRLRLSRVEGAGNTAGSLYALSTVGSILGSFLPVLVLIPTVGTYWTFYLFGLALLLTSAAGLLLLRVWSGAVVAAGAAVAVLALGLFTGHAVVRPPEFGKLVHEEESAYNYIQVVKQNGTYMLVLNDGHAVHSLYNPSATRYYGYWDDVTLAPLFNADAGVSDVRSAAIIGLAGGTVVQQLNAAYGPIPIDGVEIDPKIVAVGRRYFNMNQPNLNVIVQDGRYFVATTDKRYDLVAIDAYRQPYVPFQLVTREFFQQVSDRLTPNGTLVINAGRTQTDFRLVDVIATTLKSVYPNVYVFDDDRYTNSIVIATKQPTRLGDFTRNIDALSPGFLKLVGDQVLQSGNVREWTGMNPDLVFTDDHAPVEWIIDSMIVDAARGK